PSIFILSTKSEQQLKTYAQDMKRWMQEHSELALSDIAFTLQVGRQAMYYRLAIVAGSREVLLQRLEEFINNQASKGVYTAQVKRSLRAGAVGIVPCADPVPTSLPVNDAMRLEADEDAQSLLHIWRQKRKNLEKVAEIWLKGVNVDWKILYTVGTGLACGD